MFQDAFFYCLVFDPSQKTLLADKGEIRVGSRYQTEVTNLLKEGMLTVLKKNVLKSEPSQCSKVVFVIVRRGRRAGERRAGDAGVDAGARAHGPADRPVPGGLAVGGHVRARARLLLERQAAQPPHVGRRRQPGYYTGMAYVSCGLRYFGRQDRPVLGGLATSAVLLAYVLV